MINKDGEKHKTKKQTKKTRKANASQAYIGESEEMNSRDEQRTTSTLFTWLTIGARGGLFEEEEEKRAVFHSPGINLPYNGGLVRCIYLNFLFFLFLFPFFLEPTESGEGGRKNNKKVFFSCQQERKSEKTLGCPRG